MGLGGEPLLSTELRAFPSGSLSGLEHAATECLNLAIDRVSHEGSSVPSGLVGGLSGIGWIVQHVNGLFRDVLGAEVADVDDLLDDLDRVLLNRLGEPAWREGYDLIGGLVGIGTYLLERLPARHAPRGLERIVLILKATALRDADGIYWYTPPPQVNNHLKGYYNLGVAHGIPGIAYLLAQAVHVGIESDTAGRLLEGTVAWLQAQDRSLHHVQRFGCWIVPGGGQLDSRLGWCYGDLGIGASLHEVARTVGRKDWQAFAGDLVGGTFAWPEEKNLIFDAGLCHGAIGVAHIHNRMWQATDDERYRQEANRWYRRGLELRRPGCGPGGFYSSRPDKDQPYSEDRSLISGSIGAALGLISAVYPVEPQWDRMLLLSSRFTRRQDAGVPESQCPPCPLQQRAR